MKLLTNIAQIIVVAVLILICIRPSSVSAQAEPVQAAGSQGINIVGGEDAEQGEWGWQVMVNAGFYLCGGSLIATDWVATAAHCVYDNDHNLYTPDQVMITAGETNRRRLEGTEQAVAAAEIFVFEGYNAVSNENDIALIRLSSPIVLNDAIEIVPLLDEAHLELAAPEKLATVTGWGTTSEGGTTSRTLQEVVVPIVATDVCNHSYGIINENMICAGYAEGGKDACQGDSGGPLVVPDEEGNWYLAGIVSFGYGCARSEFYGVYTRVSQYVTWIDETVEAHSVEIESSEEIVEEEIVEEVTETSSTIFLPMVMS